MKIAITTVFLPRENIYWLEEWIRYHLFHIGIDAIYLYDNTGSLKFDNVPFNRNTSIALSGKNLRGENISEITSHLSGADILNTLNALTLKYKGRLHIFPWHPIDEQGVPCFGQRAAYADFIGKYAKEFDWAVLTDMDEFIVNSDLKERVTYYESLGYNDIIVHPKLFTQRVTDQGPVVPALSITDCIVGVTDRDWKQIVKCSDALYPEVHQGGTWKKEWKLIFKTDLVFHHYKMGSFGYEKLRRRMPFCPKVLTIGTDNSLEKVIDSLSLESNVVIPQPKKVVLFQPNPRKVTLPEVSLLQRVIAMKEILITYLILRSRIARKVWQVLRPNIPPKIRF